MTNIVEFRPIDRRRPEEMLSLSASLASLLDRLDYSTNQLPAGVALSSTERSSILARAVEIESSCLREGDAQRRILGCVAMLSEAFPAQHKDSETRAEALFQAFSIALEDLPAWSIEAATRAWIKGEVGNKTWAPTPPQLREAAESFQLRALGIARALRRLAAAKEQAPPLSDEQRASMAERFSGLLRELGANGDAS